MTSALAEPDAPAIAAVRTRAVVHVRIGATDVGVPVDEVLMAVPLPADAGGPRLPRRQGALAGIVEVAGDVVPIVDIGRWVPTGAADPRAQPRILVLRQAQQRLGMRVDAVLGVKSVPVDAARRVHQAADDEELFESVLPADGARPVLALLEVARLMRLGRAWCEQAGTALAADARRVAQSTAPAGRWVVLAIGDALWGVPAARVRRIVPAVVPELRFGSDRGGGLCPWEGRKIALIELAGGEAPPSPWMAIVEDGAHELALGVAGCRQLIDLAQADIALRPDDPLRHGVAVVEGLGPLQLMDVAKLFETVPEAAFSRATPVRAASTGDRTAAAHESHYLVFETDRAYAAPADGVLGVVPLGAETVAELAAGHRAAIAWRGRAVNVVRLPGLGDDAAFEPRLALVARTPGGAVTGIAVHALADWIPAHRAQRSTVHMHAVGAIHMIAAQVDDRPASVVVMDLGAMAHLLG